MKYKKGVQGPAGVQGPPGATLTKEQAEHISSLMENFRIKEKIKTSAEMAKIKWWQFWK